MISEKKYQILIIFYKIMLKFSLLIIILKLMKKKINVKNISNCLGYLFNTLNEKKSNNCAI